MEMTDVMGNGRKQDMSEGYKVVKIPEPEGDHLYEIAKQNVQNRFRLIMHWAVFALAQIIFFTIASMIGWSEFLGFIDAVWLAVVCLHTVYCFIKITPAKIQKEYHKLARKMK